MYVIQMSSIISFKLLVASLNLVCDNILVYTYKYLNVWKLLACQPVIKLSSIFSPITSGLHAGQGVKAMSHEEICPCNLQCKFCRKNIAGCSQDVRLTQLVLRPAMRLYFTPAEYFKMSAQHCEKQKLLLLSLQLATQFFVARLVANMGCHTRTSSLQLAMQRHCAASCKENGLV